MLYDIALKIDYRYENPANSSRHIVRLQPASIPDQQRLVAASLTLTPQPDEWFDRVDFFGNRIVEAAYFKRHDNIRLALQCRVERPDSPATLDTSPTIAALQIEIARQRALTGMAPIHFMGTSKRIELSDEVTRYANGLVPLHASTRSIVEALGAAIHRDMAYDPQATTVETPLLTAFRGRHGVCQDFAHIMIAGLRGIGIPAGYVSGVLRTTPPPGKARLEGADAMHAWVMAWCGNELGWVEYDPTNAVFVGRDHVVIARGRDYFDVSPVRGVMRTHGKHDSKQSVDVIPVA